MNPPNPIESIIDTIENLKQQDRFHDARETALQALTRYTDDYRLYEELADIYLIENNLEKAEEVIRYARELHPESWTGIYLEWYIAVARGDFDHAIEVLREANKIMPNNPEIIRNLWWASVMKGDISRGLSLLRRAYTLAPDDLMIANDLSVALMASGNEEEARELFEKTGNTRAFNTLNSIDLQ